MPATRSLKGKLRYDSKTVGAEIEAGRERLGFSVIEATEALGMSRTYWYKKVAGAPPFRIEEIGLLAERFDAPRGWPFVPWHEGLAWERHLQPR